MGVSLLSAILAKHRSHDQLTHGNRDSDSTNSDELDRLMDAISRRSKGRIDRTDLPNLLDASPSTLNDTRSMDGSEAQHRRVRNQKRKTSLSPDTRVAFTHQGNKVYGRVRAIRGDGSILLDLEEDRGQLTIPPSSSKQFVVKALLQKHLGPGDTVHPQGRHGRRGGNAGGTEDQTSRDVEETKGGKPKAPTDSAPSFPGLPEGANNEVAQLERNWRPASPISEADRDRMGRAMDEFNKPKELEPWIKPWTPGPMTDKQMQQMAEDVKDWKPPRGIGEDSLRPFQPSWSGWDRIPGSIDEKGNITPYESEGLSSYAQDLAERIAENKAAGTFGNQTGSETPAPAAPTNDLSFSPRGLPLGHLLDGEDPILVQRTIQEQMGKYGTRMTYVDENAGFKHSSNPKKNKRGIDTMGEYGIWDDENNFQGWTTEREALHTQMLQAELDRQRLKNDGRSPLQERQVIIMAGLPGSGKTHILDNVLSGDPANGGLFDTRDYVIVNADEMKEHVYHLGNPTDPTGGDLSMGEMSSMLHEESSHLSKELRDLMMLNGTNIAMDITAANREQTLGDIQAFSEAGYTVHIVHADVEVEEAIASALTRAGGKGENSFEKTGKLSRVVPVPFIRSLQDDSAGTDVVGLSFADYVEKADGQVHWFRNFPLTHRDPVSVWSRPSYQPSLPGVGAPAA